MTNGNNSDNSINSFRLSRYSVGLKENPQEKQGSLFLNKSRGSGTYREGL
jgi:hypothetical protein